MNGEQLTDRVLAMYQDADEDTDQILDLLNEGLVVVASRVRLPELEATATVDTVVDDHLVALPINYQRGLFDCQNPKRYNPIKVLNSKKQMLTRTGDLKNTGSDVVYVCVEGSNLIYQPIASTVKTLTLSFYELPTAIAIKTSPDCLPIEFHRMLAHYAAFMLFDDLEDSMEGPKGNTANHGNRFEKMLKALKKRFKDSQSMPNPPVVKGVYL